MKRAQPMRRRSSIRPSRRSSIRSLSKIPRIGLNWGPYLAERQWATIREDCSNDGSCWEYSTYESSHKNPYIGGEDGLMGICDDQCRICFSWGFWNEKDAFVKEKLFGLKGGLQAEGNHGEDVKEAYFYQLNIPSHDYMQMKYMYPCEPFPYSGLREENSRRSVHDDEFEIYDTQIFDKGFWELRVEYCRINSDDVLARLTARNRSSVKNTLHILPTVWFRNDWNTIYQKSLRGRMTASVPTIQRIGMSDVVTCVSKSIKTPVYVHFQPERISLKPKSILFTTNETGKKQLISDYVCARKNLPNLPATGTKCSGHYVITCRPSEERSVMVVLSQQQFPTDMQNLASQIFTQKVAAEDFYKKNLRWLRHLDPECKEIVKLAYSGLLWNKQYYSYTFKTFCQARDKALGAGKYFKWNPKDWDHLDNHDILSMPDKWEFPWYASWDSCFHAVVLVDIDPEFAMKQLELILSDRYMSPTGQVPGCEFNYSDDNPPVMSWAVWEIYTSSLDMMFLKNAYPKLVKNFDWWLTQRKVAASPNSEILFQSGFLGMDNISALDRSLVPEGCALYEADAYAWVFITALNCLQAAVQLKRKKDIPYWIQWLARLQRGFTHFSDSFCYDILQRSSDREFVKIKSMVGLLPLAALHTFDCSLGKFSDLIRKHGLRVEEHGSCLLVSLLTSVQRKAVIDELFAKNAFLGPFGIRMVSKFHEANPYTINVNGQDFTLNFEPGESQTHMYLGNSNWRGPVWLCMNYMLVQALLRLHSWQPLLVKTQELGLVHLSDCAKDISRRIVGIFRQNADGRRAVHGECQYFDKSNSKTGYWPEAEYVLFYEYFHCETGRGCGASHQTGWSALIVKFMQILYDSYPI